MRFKDNAMKVMTQLLKFLLVIPIVVVVILALDPVETANKKRDEQYLATARHFQEAAVKYFSQNPLAASYGFAPAGKLGFAALELDPNDKFIAANINNFYIGKAQGAAAMVYVCYPPLARFNRDAACNDGNVYTLNSDNGNRVAVNCTVSSIWPTNGANAWMICNPN